MSMHIHVSLGIHVHYNSSIVFKWYLEKANMTPYTFFSIRIQRTCDSQCWTIQNQNKVASEVRNVRIAMKQDAPTLCNQLFWQPHTCMYTCGWLRMPGLTAPVLKRLRTRTSVKSLPAALATCSMIVSMIKIAGREPASVCGFKLVLQQCLVKQN